VRRIRPGRANSFHVSERSHVILSSRALRCQCWGITFTLLAQAHTQVLVTVELECVESHIHAKDPITGSASEILLLSSPWHDDPEFQGQDEASTYKTPINAGISKAHSHCRAHACLAKRRSLRVRWTW
jgi:hypothetical protein